MRLFRSRYLSDIFTSSVETDVKKNVLAKHLFLGLVRFMPGWSLHLSIIPEIVSSSKEIVWVEKL